MNKNESLDLDLRIKTHKYFLPFKSQNLQEDKTIVKRFRVIKQLYMKSLELQRQSLQLICWTLIILDYFRAQRTACIVYSLKGSSNKCAL